MAKKKGKRATSGNNKKKNSVAKKQGDDVPSSQLPAIPTSTDIVADLNVTDGTPDTVIETAPTDQSNASDVVGDVAATNTTEVNDTKSADSEQHQRQPEGFETVQKATESTESGLEKASGEEPVTENPEEMTAAVASVEHSTEEEQPPPENASSEEKKPLVAANDEPTTSVEETAADVQSPPETASANIGDAAFGEEKATVDELPGPETVSTETPTPPPPAANSVQDDSEPTKCEESVTPDEQPSPPAGTVPVESINLDKEAPVAEQSASETVTTEDPTPPPEENARDETETTKCDEAMPPDEQPSPLATAALIKSAQEIAVDHKVPPEIKTTENPAPRSTESVQGVTQPTKVTPNEMPPPLATPAASEIIKSSEESGIDEKQALGLASTEMQNQPHSVPEDSIESPVAEATTSAEVHPFDEYEKRNESAGISESSDTKIQSESPPLDEGNPTTTDSLLKVAIDVVDDKENHGARAENTGTSTAEPAEGPTMKSPSAVSNKAPTPGEETKQSPLSQSRNTEWNDNNYQPGCCCQS